MPASDKEALTLDPWAARIGTALVLIILAIAAFTALDRARTKSLETVLTPTAVGDNHYASQPAANTSATGLKYQGRDLNKIGEEKLRDATLLRESSDDSGTYNIYRLQDETGKDHHLYLKAGENEYIQVQPQ